MCDMLGSLPQPMNRKRPPIPAAVERRGIYVQRDTRRVFDMHCLRALIKQIACQESLLAEKAPKQPQDTTRVMCRDRVPDYRSPPPPHHAHRLERQLPARLGQRQAHQCDRTIQNPHRQSLETNQTCHRASQNEQHMRGGHLAVEQ